MPQVAPQSLGTRDGAGFIVLLAVAVSASVFLAIGVIVIALVAVMR